MYLVGYVMNYDMMFYRKRAQKEDKISAKKGQTTFARTLLVTSYVKDDKDYKEIVKPGKDGC